MTRVTPGVSPPAPAVTTSTQGEGGVTGKARPSEVHGGTSPSEVDSPAGEVLTKHATRIMQQSAPPRARRTRLQLPIETNAQAHNPPATPHPHKKATTTTAYRVTGSTGRARPIRMDGGTSPSEVDSSADGDMTIT